MITKVYLVSEAKPRDTNIPRVLLPLVNDPPSLLVPKAKPRDSRIPMLLLLLVNDPPSLLVHKVMPSDTISICYNYLDPVSALNQ